MKKRTIISLIITIICVILTNRMWLEYKPIPVSFDISGNGEYTITAVFNKKNNNKFVVKKTKHGTTEAELKNDFQNIKIDVNRIKHPQRVKIMFSKLTADNGNIIIKNIQLKNGELKLDDFENFTPKNATVKTDKDKFILTPSGIAFQLIYDKPLKI